MDKIEILKVKDVVIDNNENARRINIKDLRKSDLYASISQFGIRVPIAVQNYGGSYKLVAGFRRMACAIDLKLESVLAHVITVSTNPTSDASFHNYIENACREDLTTLEQAATAAMLVERMKDLDTVALILGISKGTLNKRLMINKLAPCWKKELKENAYLPLAAIDLIAALPQETQDTLHGQLHYMDRFTVSEVQRQIDNLTCKIKDARFDTTKCLVCKSNSSNSKELFPEYDKDARCLNSECYRKQQKEALINDLKKFAETHPDAVYAQSDTYNDHLNNPTSLKEVESWSLQKASKEDIKKGNFKYVVYSDGHVEQVKTPKKEKAAKNKPVQKPEEKREGLAIAKTIADLLAAIREKNAPAVLDTGILAVYGVLFGAKFDRVRTFDDLSKTYNNLAGDKFIHYETPVFKDQSWQEYKDTQVGLQAIMWDRIRMAMIDCINKKPTAVQAIEQRGLLQYIADIIKFDLQAAIKSHEKPVKAAKGKKAK